MSYLNLITHQLIKPYVRQAIIKEIKLNVMQDKLNSCNLSNISIYLNLH